MNCGRECHWDRKFRAAKSPWYLRAALSYALARGDELQVLQAHEIELLSVVFSPDGKRIALRMKQTEIKKGILI